MGYLVVLHRGGVIVNPADHVKGRFERAGHPAGEMAHMFTGEIGAPIGPGQNRIGISPTALVVVCKPAKIVLDPVPRHRV